MCRFMESGTRPPRGILVGCSTNNSFRYLCHSSNSIFMRLVSEILVCNASHWAHLFTPSTAFCERWCHLCIGALQLKQLVMLLCTPSKFLHSIIQGNKDAADNIFPMEKSCFSAEKGFCLKQKKGIFCLKNGVEVGALLQP